MTNTREDLTREMRKAGFGQAAIDAAWPSWWTDEAEASPSSRAELRFALSRRLGLSAKPLLGERVEFFWDDAARFKHLRAQNDRERSTIASFGIALGLELIEATPEPTGADWRGTGAIELRNILLRDRPFVDLSALVATCWSFGIPIIHLNVVPLASKSMHAMVVQNRGRFAILLAHKVNYPAQAAFTIAHELGHVLLRHLGDKNALVDLEDPA
ncbi:MAG: ImmA/IrrE family metallo-endopeptidase [Alphaproteobacteria bacterium]|nr:ImmA/IrrE family metallo-endopeptidase [Alphaproteobacteria bacterium]